MTRLDSNSNPAARSALQLVLGYLNFSSGSPDPKFLAGLNEIFALVEQFPPYQLAAAAGGWQRVSELLRDGLARLRNEQSAFADAKQAERAIDLVFGHVLPAYRAFHSDLLFHQSDDALFRPLFVGRACEAVLSLGSLDDERDVTRRAIRRLNDFVGHRPIAALQSRKHEPYAHERIRPVPLYVEDAGIGVGRYHNVVQIALDIVRDTDPELLRAAQLDPALLNELAFDPRAYDFEHPANKRPNYHFGQWDPHHLDNSGRYRRLVVQQVTLDALMERVESPGEIPAAEAVYEGGAVLAGVMLMSTGISGWGPEAHDSNVTLGNLLPHIAAYRDEFYKQLLAKISGAHGRRLKLEAKRLKQPFAEARQHLNAALTRRRAAQVGHVQMAKIFAKMGFPHAAQRHADIVPSTAARLLCRIDCGVSETRQALDAHDRAKAAELLAQMEELLKRGIDCGAIIDPWNILGFDAHFSLFPALENSIRDFRADDLADLLEQMFELYTATWCAAAAANERPVVERIRGQMKRLADWWHQFAAHEVSAVEAPNGQQAFTAAEHVAQILGEWHQAGAAGGDVAFWAPHAHEFDSPKAYATVVKSLLDGRDYVASMALLVHWLSRAEETGLEQGESSFTELIVRWLRQLQQDAAYATKRSDGLSRWKLTRRLFDSFEANAEEYGDAPRFELGVPGNGLGQPKKKNVDPFSDDDLEADEEDSPYGAAYDDVVYRDSTGDGNEADILDYGAPSEDELEAESKRINLRLGFLIGLAQLWKQAAWRPDDAPAAERRDALRSWFDHSQRIDRGLKNLIAQVSAHHIRAASVDCDALVEFDRQRSIHEALMERIIAAQVEVADAAHFVRAAMQATEDTIGRDDEWPITLSGDNRQAVSLMAALLRGEAPEARARCAEYLESLRDLPLLYVPLGRGGVAEEIVSARIRQRMLQNFLILLPRLALLTEARNVLDTARKLEREHPVGPGAVTEFDDLFEVGYRAMVDCVISAAEDWPTTDEHSDESAVVTLLEQMTQSMIETWLAHSRTLRLSVLERVTDDKPWTQLVRFIKRYGGDLFTQQFLNLGNVRAIQHQGVESWLGQAERDPAYAGRLKLLDELDQALSRRRAVKCLSLIIDAISENYVEYRDYNATTTQSDRGEMLYMLLDFLRLRVAYDRIAWNLRPVIVAHESLVRRGHTHAAQLWRRALSERFEDEADKFLRRFNELRTEYAMNMPTVAERLAERFVQPMTIDRLRALVEPAVRERGEGDASTYFSLLEQEANVLARECGGVGLDVPPWLIALEEEVVRARRADFDRDEEELLADVIPQVRLSFEQLETLLRQWTRD